MDKANPPMGFISRDWSEGTKDCGSSGATEETRPPVPTPVSQDNGRTLDWSKSRDDDTTLLSPPVLYHTVQCEQLIIVTDPEDEGRLRFYAFR